eukprot:jgi/Phyca11/533960/estExt2_fgenesh1_pg.C_PHYCAscaffold_190041
MSTRSKQTRLLRQASVLHELQESAEKDSLDSRYARLMTELAALCSDRSNVLTVESLQFFASNGRAEPVKLERAPDRDTEAQHKTSQATKQDELLSADAARRQRVEELTRFFMEAKSDIEFALGGGRDFHEAKDKDKDAESERDEDKEDADDEEDTQEDAQDPERQLAKLHRKLLKEKVDNRVYNVMLSQIREQDPALYGAILCHPLVTGVDPKKDKKKKKKRKDRERKEKQPSQTNLGAASAEMDLDSDSGSIARLRARLSRFGDDGVDGDDDDDDEEEEENQGEDSLSREGVDEDALMARAIALSLSPETCNMPQPIILLGFENKQSRRGYELLLFSTMDNMSDT